MKWTAPFLLVLTLITLAPGCTDDPKAKEKAEKASEELRHAVMKLSENEAALKEIETKLKLAEDSDPGLKAQLLQEKEAVRSRIARWKLRLPADIQSGGGGGAHH